MNGDSARPGQDDSPGLARVERNIQALLARRREEEGSRGLEARIAHAITRAIGDMRFVYLNLIGFALWIGINLGWLSVIPRFDPTLAMLAIIGSIEAIVISTFVLITQNRMAALADKRADLDLQISLLTEHEITQLIALVTPMAERMGIEAAQNPELAELAQDVPPEKVMDKMEAHERAIDPEG